MSARSVRTETIGTVELTHNQKSATRGLIVQLLQDDDLWYG